MATKSKSILKIALFIIIAFLGSSFSGVVLAKSKSPSDKKLLIDFDKSFKEIAVNLSSNLPSIDKELFKRVVTLRTNKIVGREEVTEDRLRVAFLVHTKVDVHMVSIITSLTSPPLPITL